MHQLAPKVECGGFFKEGIHSSLYILFNKYSIDCPGVGELHVLPKKEIAFMPQGSSETHNIGA